MGLDLDLTQKVVNVSWGAKASFVVKSIVGVYWVSSDQKAEKWNLLGFPPDNNTGGGGVGLSYAEIETDTGTGTTKKGIFVSSAMGFDDAGNNWGAILASDNGSDWEMVFKTDYLVSDGESRSPEELAFTGTVWDDGQKMFYAAFVQTDGQHPLNDLGIDDNPTFLKGEVIYSSPDGRTWSKVSADVSHEPGDWGDGISALQSHFVKPENKDGVPDGLQGYNKSAGVLIYPTGLVGYKESGADYSTQPPARPPSSVEVRYDNPDDEKVDRTASVSMPCYAVGYYGGLFVATGGYIDSENSIWSTKIDVSSDDGKTWTNVMNHTVGPAQYEAGWGAAAIGGSRIKPEESA